MIAEPEITEFDFGEKDQWVLLATDGVWEFITSQEAVEIVSANMGKGKISAAKACQALIEQAAIRWRHAEGDYRDDITAIIIRLSPFDLIGRDNRRADRRSRMDFNASEGVDKFTEKDMEDLRGSMGLADSAS